MFYSKSTGGFYDPNINTDIPSDAVEITTAYWQELLAGQSEGKLIEAGADGYPILQDRPAPTPEEIAAAVSVARQAAYQKESDPLYFMWKRGEATEQDWLDKVAEIKARYPDGVMPS